MSFEIRKVGVIGAGQMGKGIAQVSALAGYDVVLNDISAERIDAAVKDIAVQMRKSAERGHMAADAVEAALPHITGGPRLADLGDADLIIEAATENEEIKRAVLIDVAQVAKPEAIIASGSLPHTSCCARSS